MWRLPSFILPADFVLCYSHPIPGQAQPSMEGEDDQMMMAAMGIGGFGKQKKSNKTITGPSQENEIGIRPMVPSTSADTGPAHDRQRYSYSGTPSQSIIPTANSGPAGTSISHPNVHGGHPNVHAHPNVQGDNVKDNDNDNADSDSDEYGSEQDSPQFPNTHTATLKQHKKVISALALDPSGARFASGAHDYDVKLWDFGGMGGGIGRPFKSFEPAENYYVNDLKYSIAGDQLLVISGTAQAKIYDRDGEEKQTYIKGDPYIRDMKNTAGHVGELSAGAWHPKDPQTFITSSADSTIRIWDIENKRKQKTVIVVKSKERGARTKITSCSYSHDGGLIAAACYDGAVHLWSTTSNFVRPNMTTENAHGKSTETGSVVLSLDGRTLLTRGGDDTVKTWDIRNFKKSLYSVGGLTSLYPGMNAIWSPDEKYIVVGSGTPPANGRAAGGKLSFLKREGLTVVDEMEMTSCVVKVMWHSKINQIFTTHADGSIQIHYSPHTSTNGAKLLNRAQARRAYTVEDASAALLTAPVITPGEGTKDDQLSAFEFGTTSKRKRDKERLDPRKSMRPELPVSGPGRGGRVGASATQHVVQNLVRDTMRDEDPREALLRIGQIVDQDRQWTKAWQQNQPNPVFRQEEEEKEDSD